MEEMQRAGLLRTKLDREELALRRQIVEQQRRVAEIAMIEQEKNPLRTGRFRRELKRQIIQRQEMDEAVKQQELRKLQIA
jgi:hypothetical protein